VFPRRRRRWPARAAAVAPRHGALGAAVGDALALLAALDPLVAAARALVVLGDALHARDLERVEVAAAG
jgi:hypothetical protein